MMRRAGLVISLIMTVALGMLATAVAAADTAQAATTTATTTAITATSAASGCQPYSDVDAKNVHCKNIAWLKDQRITKPANNKFQPNAAMTRGAMTAMLYRLAHPGQPAPACDAKPYKDVAVDSTFCGYIAWASKKKIARGYTDGTFRPGASVTRGAMAAFLHRSYGSGAAPDCIQSPAVDVSTGDQFCGVITWMVRNNITSGVGCGYYGTTWPVTRGSMASFLKRASTGSLNNQGPNTLAASAGCFRPTPPPEALTDVRAGLCAPHAAACIDLTNDLSWLQKEGKIIYGPVPITSGKVGFSTRPGNWKVFWKNRDHRSSIYGGTPMPYAIFFDGGIAFHQGSLEIPSHGCIHLSWEAAAKYWDVLSNGDVVSVFGKARY